MSVQVVDEQALPVDTSALASLAELVLRREGYPPDSEMTVMMVGDEEMAAYNERFLSRSGPTDVLAFPLESMVPGSPPRRQDGGPPLSLGDVVVAPAYVERQARDLGVGFGDELSLMVVHGILHLMGYDHEDDEDAAVMERREQEILGEIGVERR